MRLVKIKWLDHAAFTHTQWREAEDYDDLTPVTVETLGWILKDDPTYYLVVATCADNGNYAGDFLILKSCVLEVKELS